MHDFTCNRVFLHCGAAAFTFIQDLSTSSNSGYVLRLSITVRCPSKAGK